MGEDVLDSAGWLARLEAGLIGFTADWCFNCKTNEAVAADRPEAAEFLRQHGITAILADYTDESPEIARWLELSRTEGVPLTLIFPKGRSNRAIPLRGVYTQSQLLEALRDAVGGDRAAQPVEVSTGSTTGTPATIASPAGGAMAK
ncbi:MAG: thioredoxin family protein [Planctomycetaceae bacterium]